MAMFDWPADAPDASAAVAAIGAAVARAAAERIQAVEAACYVALDRGCGVRVDDYQDGGWAVRVDESNLNMEIREYRHGHSQYNNAHYPCPNCDSRDAGR